MLFSLNGFSREFAYTAEDFFINNKDLDALIAASRVQCGKKFGDYNFEKEFKKLFNYSYSNRDVSKIKKMSIEIDKDLRDFCKKNQYLATGFKTQHCYETCSKNYSKNDLIKEQCQATCTSVEAKIDSFTKNLATLVNEDVVDTEKCTNGTIRVDDTSRGKVKEKGQMRRAVDPANSSGVTAK